MQFFADMGDSPFLLSGLLAGLLASVACGITGPYVVTRRMVFLAAAIAHIALGGIGASIYVTYRWPEVFGWLDPLRGATLVSIVAAAALAWLSHRAGERLDTVIGALWSIGMATGILLVKLTPGYHTELMSYLFGNLSLVRPSDLVLMVVLNVGIVVVALLYHKRFLAVSLDDEQAQLQGLDPLRIDTVLLILVALTVILLTRVVGLILVIALISLPAAAAIPPCDETERRDRHDHRSLRGSHDGSAHRGLRHVDQSRARDRSRRGGRVSTFGTHGQAAGSSKASRAGTGQSGEPPRSRRPRPSLSRAAGPLPGLAGGVRPIELR